METKEKGRVWKRRAGGAVLDYVLEPGAGSGCVLALRTETRLGPRGDVIFSYGEGRRGQGADRLSCALGGFIYLLHLPDRSILGP